jgi:hypothetical protein
MLAFQLLYCLSLWYWRKRAGTRLSGLAVFIVVAAVCWVIERFSSWSRRRWELRHGRWRIVPARRHLALVQQDQLRSVTASPAMMARGYRCHPRSSSREIEEQDGL